METAPKLLLVAHGAPDAPHAGAVFLQRLCVGYPEGRLVRFSVDGKATPGEVTTWQGLTVMAGLRPREKVGGMWRSLRPLTSFWIHDRIRRVQAPALARQAADFARAQGVEAVWVVLHRPTLIYMAEETARLLGVPLIVTVNDPPESFAKDLRMHRLVARRMYRAFERCIRSCHGLGTASEPMRAAYRERFGRESEVLIMGVTPEERRPPGAYPAPDEPLVIGFAGSLYARSEWDALLRALDEADWTIAGRDVRVRHIGREPKLPEFAEGYVECMGWRTPEEAADLMASSHVAYLPYWFDRDRAVSVRLCFPNKMTTYLASGRPIFFHGPEVSSPSEFLARYPAGVACHSLETGKIRSALTSLVEDSAPYDAAVAAGQRALDEELNVDEFVRRFRKTVAGT